MQIVLARQSRRATGSAAIKAQTETGTFDDITLKTLQHSYLLMCGGEGKGTGLQASQLQELAVMADLDATSAATAQLLHELVRVLSDDTTCTCCCHATCTDAHVDAHSCSSCVLAAHAAARLARTRVADVVHA